MAVFKGLQPFWQLTLHLHIKLIIKKFPTNKPIYLTAFISVVSFIALSFSARFCKTLQNFVISSNSYNIQLYVFGYFQSTANYYRLITDKLRFLSANFQISVIITDKYQPKQQLHRQMTVDITHDCIWILNADKHLRFLQSKHLQCEKRWLNQPPSTTYVCFALKTSIYYKRVCIVIKQKKLHKLQWTGDMCL